MLALAAGGAQALSLALPGSGQPIWWLQVLSLAGGLDKFADEDAIKVVRNRGGAQETLLIAYADLIAARDMSTNMQLQAGDTLVVP